CSALGVPLQLQPLGIVVSSCSLNEFCDSENCSRASRLTERYTGKPLSSYPSSSQKNPCEAKLSRSIALTASTFAVSRSFRTNGRDCPSLYILTSSAGKALKRPAPSWSVGLREPCS